jgi:disulfide bond formation protein DsbB
MDTRRFDIAELLNGVGLAGLIGVLLVAYLDQFAGHDLPCPLCLLQRVAVAGVAFGMLLNLRYGPQQSGYGIMLLAALFGMAVAGRQILLHVAPGTGSYGAALYGLHFYTWSFLLFAAVILGTAILLLTSTSSPAPPRSSWRGWSRQGWRGAGWCWRGTSWGWHCW